MRISPESIGYIVAGLLLCFAGWQFFRISVRLLGFILGASIGYALGTVTLDALWKGFPAAWEPWAILAVTLLFGIFGIFMIKTVVKVVLFLAGFVFGTVVVALYSGTLKGVLHPDGLIVILRNSSPWSLLSGVVFGVLFVFFEKGFVILYTAAVGAYLVAVHLGGQAVVFYGMLILGAAAQFWMSRGAGVKNLRISKGGKA